jgi:hypothetical protein
MARRDRGTSSDPTEASATAEATDPTEEATVTETATEPTVPEQDAPKTEAPASAKTQKASEVDLTAFSNAVEASVAERDDTTGELATAQIEPVVAEYRKIEGIAGKNKAKAYLTDKMRDAMNEMDISLARSYMMLQDNLSAGAAPKTERVPADPTEAHIQRVVGLDLARALLVKPEGVSDDADTRAEKLYSEVYPQAEAYLAWSANEAEDKGDEPETPGFVKNAVKLALGKAAKVGGSRVGGGGGTGERHDIGEHIRQAFESQESGAFLTVAQIRNFKSTEYGDNQPSAGAISARLFPQSGKCTLDFVTPGQNKDGNRGATKN